MKKIIQHLRFLISKLNAPKYTRHGSCKKCGRCCREITFRLDNNLITTQEEFETIQKQNPFYKNFFISGKDPTGTILFTCKHLSWENTCQIHIIRPQMCRNYPCKKDNLKPETFLECGYYFRIDKPFKKFIHK
ncbi:MAG: YkgJ family cysteine cluster protein [Candidatus Gastranaerophilales bacterium]|nr:YkgJ family cysteine cluster protein [Candidatus Gastranaerophilales bacterium]